MHHQQALHDASEFSALYAECEQRMKFLDLVGDRVASKPQSLEVIDEYARVAELRLMLKAEMTRLLESFESRHITAKHPVCT